MLYLMHSRAYVGHCEVKVMATENKSDSHRSRDPAGDEDEIEIPSSGEATVETRDKPTRAPAGKKIHPRRPLPPVPDSDRSNED
jgi:hypothetical protein